MMLMLHPMYCGDADERRIGILVIDGKVVQAKFIHHEDLKKGQADFRGDMNDVEEGDMEGKEVSFISAQGYIDLDNGFTVLKDRDRKQKAEIRLLKQERNQLKKKVEDLKASPFTDQRIKIRDNTIDALKSELADTRADLNMKAIHLSEAQAAMVIMEDLIDQPFGDALESLIKLVKPEAVQKD